MASGRYQAILDSDSLGRFSFAVPPAGAYTLVVLDPAYQGEMTFASDGRSAFPLEFAVAPRPRTLELTVSPDPARTDRP